MSKSPPEKPALNHEAAQIETAKHHGGAWKVAAADFFTAMMALFMVMWILSQDDELLEQTAFFFNNPYTALGEMEKSMNPIDLGGSNSLTGDEDSNMSGAGKRDFVEQLAQEFVKHLNINADDQESPLSVNSTSDGLILTVFNRSQKPLFDTNTSEFTEWGILVMRNIAWLIDRYDLNVRIEAHTMPNFEGNEDYSAWELSADQANAVRRTLVYYALDEKKLSRVTAFANTRPIQGVDPASESHQRIEISLEPKNYTS